MSGEVSVVIALALGEPFEARSVSWSRALEIARWERCAALAWLRSAAAIRSYAPPNVVTAWREEAFAVAALSDMWARVTTSAIERLESAGVHPVVMKGLPVSQRLYGDIGARPCSDLDLYVHEPEREAAEQALLGAGWKLRAGRAPREACYVTEFADREVMLEVHSRLLDDALVYHLPFAPPGSAPVLISGAVVQAHDDAQLPAFLAAHLAKHSMAPLLWFIDLHTLWNSLDGDQRDKAWNAARSARAARYLGWALARADAVAAAGRGSARALRLLGVGGSLRRDRHNAVRVASLAEHPLDALRTAAAWVFPPALRSHGPGMRGLFARRIAAPLRRARGTRRTYDHVGIDAPRSSRALMPGAADFNALATEALGRGAGFWLCATGGSMRPSIAPGAFVYLAPVGDRTLALGNVVLASTPTGGNALHRVVDIEGDRITLQGDANLNPDPSISRSAVLAVADALLVRGLSRPIPRPPLIRLRASTRAFFERLVERAARASLTAGRTRTGPTNAR